MPPVDVASLAEPERGAYNLFLEWLKCVDAHIQRDEDWLKEVIDAFWAGVFCFKSTERQAQLQKQEGVSSASCCTPGRKRSSGGRYKAGAVRNRAAEKERKRGERNRPSEKGRKRGEGY